VIRPISPTVASSGQDQRGFAQSPAAATPPAGRARRSSSVRDAGYLVTSQVLASGFMFGLGIVLARALGPAGKGYYDIAVGSAMLLMTFLGFSLSSGIFYYAARGAFEHRRLLVVLLLVAVAQGGVAAAVLAGFGHHPLLSWMLPGGSVVPAALLIATLLAVLQGQQFVRAVATGRGRFDAFSLSEVLGRGAALLAVVMLAVAGVASPVPYVLVFALAMIGAVLWLGVVAWREPVTSSALPLAGMALYSMPLFVGNVVQFLNYRLDIFFLKGFLSLGAVGTYTVAVGIAQLLWLIPNALGSLVMRATAAHGGTEGVLRRVAEVNRFCLYLGMAAALGLAFAASVLLEAVFGRDFSGSMRPLLVLLPGVVLFCPTIVLSAYLNGIRKQVYTTWVACGSLVVTVVLNLLLIPRIGIAGAAAASTASYTVSSLVTTVLVLRLNRGTALGPFYLPQPADAQRVAALARGALARLGGGGG
jgi:O-antigen/teichoic acid export membrane protein